MTTTPPPPQQQTYPGMGAANERQQLDLLVYTACLRPPVKDDSPPETEEKKIEELAQAKAEFMKKFLGTSDLSAVPEGGRLWNTSRGEVFVVPMQEYYLHELLRTCNNLSRFLSKSRRWVTWLKNTHAGDKKAANGDLVDRREVGLTGVATRHREWRTSGVALAKARISMDMAVYPPWAQKTNLRLNRVPIPPPPDRKEWPSEVPKSCVRLLADLPARMAEIGLMQLMALAARMAMFERSAPLDTPLPHLETHQMTAAQLVGQSLHLLLKLDPRALQEKVTVGVTIYPSLTHEALPAGAGLWVAMPGSLDVVSATQVVSAARLTRLGATGPTTPDPSTPSPPDAPASSP